MINEEEKKYFSEFKGKMEKTAYIRLNLSERMERDDRISIVFSSILSIYLVSSSVALFAYDGLASSKEGHAVTLIGIIVSISLLVANLLDGLQGRALKAKEMRDAGQTILKLATSIDLELVSSSPNVERVREAIKEYHKIIDYHGQNHQVWDNQLYEATEGMKRKGFWSKVNYYIQHKKLWLIRILSDWWLHAAILAFCLIGFFLLISQAISFL